MKLLKFGRVRTRVGPASRLVAVGVGGTITLVLCSLEKDRFMRVGVRFVFSSPTHFCQMHSGDDLLQMAENSKNVTLNTAFPSCVNRLFNNTDSSNRSLIWLVIPTLGMSQFLERDARSEHRMLSQSQLSSTMCEISAVEFAPQFAPQNIELNKVGLRVRVQETHRTAVKAG